MPELRWDSKTSTSLRGFSTYYATTYYAPVFMLLFLYMKRIVGSIVLSSLLLGAGCFRSNPKTSITPSVQQAASSVSALPFKSVDDYIPSDQQPTVATDTLPVAPQEETIKTGEHASASKNVIVSSLIDHQVIGNPFVILGRARAFESVVNWRISDAHGKVLGQGSVMTNAQDMGLYGSFRVRAFFADVPETDTGTAQVFTMSPKDGSEQDMVSIPVTFSKDRSVVKVYFSNVLKDPNVEHCDVVYPVTRRIVKTQNVAEVALLELLKGPTAQEQTAGSRTTIVPGTVLRSVNVSADHVATPDFSNELAYGLGGSCRVQALVSQINQTLKQFPEIETVNIFIDGQDAKLKLQP